MFLGVFNMFNMKQNYLEDRLQNLRDPVSLMGNQHLT